MAVERIDMVDMEHTINCDNCEKSAATFVCKSCQGHLCDKCKTEHQTKKITKNHEITELKTNNEEPVGLFFCSKHKTKRLECFCDSCQKPVCTECIVRSHNGHAFQALSTAYQQIRKDLKTKKEEIEQNLLPTYMELLNMEVNKRENLTAQADTIQKQIEKHTASVIETVQKISNETIQDLRAKEKEGLKEIDQTKSNIQKKIHRLQLTKRQLSESIETKPGISFFNAMKSDLLREFQSFPIQTNYQLYNFQPGQVGEIIPDYFGTLPDLRRFQV